MAVSIVGTSSAAQFTDTITLTVPAGASDGDLVVVYGVTTQFPSLNDPTGFTKVVEVLSGTGSSWDSKIAIFVGVVGTDVAAGGSVLVGDSGTNNNYAAAMVTLTTDESNAYLSYTPSDATGIDSLADPGDTNPTAPAISEPSDGIRLFAGCLSSENGAVTQSAPTGYTEQEDVGRTGASIMVASVAVASSGTSPSVGSAASEAAAWNASHFFVYEETDASDPTVSIDNVHGSGHAESVHDSSGYDLNADELEVTGSASDTGGSGLDRVEVRFNGGAWQAATGAASWSYTFDVSVWGAGQHTIEARSVDGAGNTSTLASESVWHSPDGVWGANSSGSGHLIAVSMEGHT